MPKIKYIGPFREVRMSTPVIKHPVNFIRGQDTDVCDEDATALLKLKDSPFVSVDIQPAAKSTKAPKEQTP